MTGPAVCGAERLHPHGGVRAIACDRDPGHVGDHAGWCRECELADDGLPDGWVPFLEAERQEIAFPRPGAYLTVDPKLPASVTSLTCRNSLAEEGHR